MTTKQFYSIFIIGIICLCFTVIVKGDSVISNVPIKENYFVQALTSSPTDSQTVYFGHLPKAPVTTAGISRVEISINGTLTGAYIYCYSGTAGTNENWVLYVRLNNLVDYVISTVGSATNQRIFENWAMNIPVVKGDYIEIKGVQPLWATNPLTTIYGGYVEVTNISNQTTEIMESENLSGVFSINEIGLFLTMTLFIFAYYSDKDKLLKPILFFMDVPLCLAIGVYYIGSTNHSIGFWIGVFMFLFSILLSFAGIYYSIHYGGKKG